LQPSDGRTDFIWQCIARIQLLLEMPEHATVHRTVLNTIQQAAKKPRADLRLLSRQSTNVYSSAAKSEICTTKLPPPPPPLLLLLLLPSGSVR
jgi:hypothetical protein